MWNFITSNGFRDNYTQNVQIAGHGNTRSVSESSITHFAEDILLQLNIPDQDEIVWIGHSMGGYIALELAEKLHNKTKGIVLFHSTLSADSELKKQDRNRAIDAAREHKNLYASNLIDGLFHKPNNHRIEIQNQLNSIQTISTQTTISCLEAMRDRESKLDFIRSSGLPIIYFSGTHDKVLPLDKMQKEWELIPHTESVIAFQCGHMGHIEKPMMALDFFEQIKLNFSS